MKKLVALMAVLALSVSMIGCGAEAVESSVADSSAAVESSVAVESSEVVESSEAVVDAPAFEEAKSEGVMTYAEYVAAPVDSEVVIETYVQAKQSWWENKGTFYTQDAEGAYFLYEMACTEEEYNQLVPGTKIKVTGYKAEWSGEVEIIDATFEILDDNTYVAEPKDITASLQADDLIKYQNIFAAFKGMVIEPSINADGEEVPFLYKWDGSGQDGDDLYFNASINEQPFNFCVESYLTGAGTDVYEAVKALEIGQTVDMEGFMYWYEGPNAHITAVSVVE